MRSPAHLQRLPAWLWHGLVVLVSVALALLIAAAFAPTPITRNASGDPSGSVVRTAQGRVFLASQEVVRDVGKLLRPEQVLAAKAQPYPLDKALTFGPTDDAFWVTTTLRNDSLQSERVLLEVAPPRLTDVRFYTATPSGAWHENLSGAVVGVGDRMVEHPSILLPVSLAANEKQIVLLRVTSITPTNFLLRLQPPEAYLAQSAQQQLQNVMVIGALVALALLAIRVAAIEWRPMQLYVGLRTLVAAVWVMQQLGYFSVWLPSSWAQLTAQQNVTLAIATVFFGTLWQLEYFRGSPGARPLMAYFRFNLVVSTLLILANLSSLLTGSQLAFWGGLFVVSIAIIAPLLAIYSIFKGFYFASVVLIGQLSTAFFSAGGVLSLLNLSPSGTRDTAIGITVVPIVYLITSLLIFLASAVRARLAHRQHRKQLIQAQQTAMAQLEAKVTERTAQLKIARDQAQTANAAKGLFLAKVSHELRTPLHSVLGYTALSQQALPSVGSAATPVRRYLSTVTDSARGLLRLIEDLVDYARMEHDTVQLLPAPCAPRELLAQLQAKTAVRTDTNGNELLVKVTPSVPAWVSIDRRRVEQIIQILLNNALRHTQAGQISLFIDTVQNTPTGVPAGQTRLLLQVQDTGEGIAAQEQARIFQPFERGRDVQRQEAGDEAGHEGLGLGLAIAQQLLEKMGSHLTLQSTLGQGSCFMFELTCPLASEPDHALEEHAQPRYTGYTVSSDASSPPQPKRVLVLDDIDSNRHFIYELLGDLGFQVDAFASQRQALAFLHQLSGATGPDLMVIDQSLGHCQTGWTFLREVRQLAGLPGMIDCPALMLSAREAQPPPDWLPAMRGIDQHLYKPCTPTELLNTISRLLDIQWTSAPIPAANPSFGAIAPTAIDIAASNAEVASAAPTASDWQTLAVAASDHELSALLLWSRRFAPAAQGWASALERLDFAAVQAYAGLQARL